MSAGAISSIMTKVETAKCVNVIFLPLEEANSIETNYRIVESSNVRY